MSTPLSQLGGELPTPTTPPMSIGAPTVEVAPGILAETARRFFSNRLSILGLIFIILILLAAIFADFLAPAPRDYAVFKDTLLPPGPGHPLGTDAVGRDFLTRILYGARTSMLVGITVPLLAALIGIPMGAAAAWYGGRIDGLFLRVIEVMTAIPLYMMVIILVSVFGAGVEKIIIFLAAISWVGGARLARAQVLALKPREYVLSARALGASDRRLLTQHILPNAAGPMVVLLVMAIPGVMFIEAGLSVLGLGVKDPIPSWGKMIAEGAPYASSHPLLGLIPIFLIAFTLLAFTFVGDGLRDALDPNSKT
jgi:ABC-type dipeptide/oligopeptide/nickel transport system permease subunit